MKKFLIIVFILMIFIPVLDLARSGRFESRLFWSVDLNKDGRISKEEAKSVYNLSDDEIFARYDKDNSGYITSLEFREFMQQKPWVKKFEHPVEKE